MYDDVLYLGSLNGSRVSLINTYYGTGVVFISSDRVQVWGKTDSLVKTDHTCIHALHAPDIMCNPSIVYLSFLLSLRGSFLLPVLHRDCVVVQHVLGQTYS